MFLLHDTLQYDDDLWLQCNVCAEWKKRERDNRRVGLLSSLQFSSFSKTTTCRFLMTSLLWYTQFCACTHTHTHPVDYVINAHRQKFLGHQTQEHIYLAIVTIVATLMSLIGLIVVVCVISEAAGKAVERQKGKAVVSESVRKRDR